MSKITEEVPKITIPPLNFNKLKNSEKNWLYNNRCKEHGRRYTEHPACFFNDTPPMSPITERIGFLDIESTNLKAIFGYVISWAIKEKDGPLYHACVTKEEIQRESSTSLETPVRIDHRILREFYKTIIKFDKVCVYWGKNRRHDIPFLRHRCLKAGVPFPLYQEVLCLDVYDWTRNFLSMHSYRLAAVCQEFEIPAKQHPLTGRIWIKANAGNKKALDFILEHNDEDVVCLEPLYDLLEPFARRQRTSI